MTLTTVPQRCLKPVALNGIFYIGNVVFGRKKLGRIELGRMVDWAEKRKLSEKYFEEISIFGDRF
jgi:hypothetical protein